MKQVPDRKKLRREYLRTKIGAATLGAVCNTLLVPSMLVAFLSGLFTLWTLLVIVAGNGVAVTSGGLIVLMAMLTCGLSMITGCIAWGLWRVRQAASARAKSLPYVPPVTANALPADEILVRGAAEPPVGQSEVLLRAATGQETPKEELLRVSQE